MGVDKSWGESEKIVGKSEKEDEEIDRLLH